MAKDANPRRTGRLRYLLKVFFAVVTLGYAGTALLIYLLQSRMVYWPTRPIEATPDDVGLPYENVEFQAADGTRLTGWYVPADRSKPVVLICHGNGGNICHRLDTLTLLNGLGFSTLIFDYRGYGHSEGKPTEEGTYQDAEAAWNYLLQRKGVAPERIVILGRSLGGAVAAHLARDHTPAALVLESTFTSAPDMAARIFFWFPARWMCRFSYDTEKTLPQIRCPVLIVHSPDDKLVPYSHGRRLFEVAPTPKEFLEISGAHNEGFLTSGAVYVDGLRRFFDRYVSVRQPDAK